jgi:hypothetical protein
MPVACRPRYANAGEAQVLIVGTKPLTSPFLSSSWRNCTRKMIHPVSAGADAETQRAEPDSLVLVWLYRVFPVDLNLDLIVKLRQLVCSRRNDTGAYRL